jgi:adenylate kinase
MTDKIAIIILGPQGSGKGTQSHILSDKIKAPIIGTGALLKSEVQKQTLNGKIIQRYLNRGLLVPELIVARTVTRALNAAEPINQVIFDGIPRKYHQIIVLNRILKDHHFTRQMVIHFNLTREEAVKRLKMRARDDDTDPIIAKRLDLYHKEIDPIIDHYKKEKILYTIDGHQSVEAISRDVSKAYRDFIHE